MWIKSRKKNSTPRNENEMSFWEHLDALRSIIIRVGIVIAVFASLGFIFKNQLFQIILAPQNSDFITYQLLDKIALACGFNPSATFSVEMINTALARQFMVHVQASIAVGVIAASPYIIFEIFRFISPALYDNERRYAATVTLCGYIMFMLGILLCYFLIFPLTFRFLATYQVSTTIENLISLDSYMETMLMLSLMMGIMFEIPIVGWLLAKLEVINHKILKTYRRHAIVIILIIAAFITPTSDAVTLCVVALPVYLLYEATILIVAKTCKH